MSCDTCRRIVVFWDETFMFVEELHGNVWGKIINEWGISNAVVNRIANPRWGGRGLFHNRFLMKLEVVLFLSLGSPNKLFDVASGSESTWSLPDVISGIFSVDRSGWLVEKPFQTRQSCVCTCHVFQNKPNRMFCAELHTWNRGLHFVCPLLW